MKKKKKKNTPEKVENIVGKEENAGYQHFLLFLQNFHLPPPQGVVSLQCMIKN